MLQDKGKTRQVPPQVPYSKQTEDRSTLQSGSGTDDPTLGVAPSLPSPTTPTTRQEDTMDLYESSGRSRQYFEDDSGTRPSLTDGDPVGNSLQRNPFTPLLLNGPSVSF